MGVLSPLRILTRLPRLQQYPYSPFLIIWGYTEANSRVSNTSSDDPTLVSSDGGFRRLYLRCGKEVQRTGEFRLRRHWSLSVQKVV